MNQSLWKNCRRLIVSQILVESVHWLKIVLAESLLPEWHKFSLHPRIMMSLHEKGFKSPTAIQAASLPFSLAERDVVGVAQTVCLTTLSLYSAFDTG
jgi:superfamily II DNA/RNA helicase